MSVDTDLLVNSYVSWLRNDIDAKALSETVSELTTPFLDRHNDHLQIYAERRSPDLFLLTDDGYIWSELKSSGVETRGSRREEIVQSLLVGHGVRLEGHELRTEATSAELGRKIHNLVQAMLSLDDMFVLAQPVLGHTFMHDVADFLDKREIRYTPAAKFTGKSGLDHLINFVIPKSRRAPERFVQFINSPRRDLVQNLLFAVNDTRNARQGDTEFYAIVNDSRRGVAAEVASAFMHTM
ncbi:MAG: DUF1828 domain-containing protein [Actinomycetota bacterium]|nr:DUF1828 domain-containing protein [Actinomycetota bacterium]